MTARIPAIMKFQHVFIFFGFIWKMLFEENFLLDSAPSGDCGCLRGDYIVVLFNQPISLSLSHSSPTYHLHSISFSLSLLFTRVLFIRVIISHFTTLFGSAVGLFRVSRLSCLFVSFSDVPRPRIIDFGLHSLNFCAIRIPNIIT